MEASAEPDEYETSVIRLEVDHADEVLWFPDTVGFEESGLSAALASDLRWWHLRSSGETDETNHLTPVGLPHSLNEVGPVLARRVAEEIGDEFEVELWADGRQERVRAGRRAKNPKARDYFASRAKEAQDEWNRAAR